MSDDPYCKFIDLLLTASKRGGADFPGCFARGDEWAVTLRSSLVDVAADIGSQVRDAQEVENLAMAEISKPALYLTTVARGNAGVVPPTAPGKRFTLDLDDDHGADTSFTNVNDVSAGGTFAKAPLAWMNDDYDRNTEMLRRHAMREHEFGYDIKPEEIEKLRSAVKAMEHMEDDEDPFVSMRKGETQDPWQAIYEAKYTESLNNY